MGQVLFRCSQCQSPKLKKLSLLFLQGTSSGNALTLGFYRGFRGNCLAQTFFKRQSLLSERAAPPRKKSFAVFLIIWLLASVFGTLILWGLAVSKSGDAALVTRVIWSLWLLFFFTISVHRFKRIALYNNTIWPNLYARWNRSYLCMQCGGVSVLP